MMFQLCTLKELTKARQISDFKIHEGKIYVRKNKLFLLFATFFDTKKKRKKCICFTRYIKNYSDLTKI